jgi:outer membrane protein
MWKKLLGSSLLVLAGLGMIATRAGAQDVKLAYIDSQRIFMEYKETQEAERLYKQEVDQWKAQAAAMEEEIVKLQDELRAQSLMLSEEKQREKKLEYDKKLEDYQRFMADTFGDDGRAAKRNKELTQPIVDKINQILEKMAEDQRFTVVFDIANANIVYIDKTLDLTDQVLAELNKTAP